MCGIFGVITKLDNGLSLPEENFIQQALIVGAVRGSDGAGLFSVDNKNHHKSDIVKKANNPYWLTLTEKEYPKFMQRASRQAKAIVGHNRASTKGENTDFNTHPFVADHITLVHNGTINYGLTYTKDVNVDSHALTIALAEKGIDVFSEIDGAFACVWHDAKNGTLNIAKNHERPLSLAKDHKGSYYFASELGMLVWLFNRNNMQGSLSQVEIKNRVLYTFDLKNLEAPKEEPLPEKKFFFTKNTTKSTTVYTTSKKQNTPEAEAFFRILDIQIEQRNNITLYSHLCLSDENEACWFTSNKQYDTEKEYYGKLTDWELDRYDLFGPRTPWYKISVKSITEFSKTIPVGNNKLTMEELADAKKAGCFCCGKNLEKNDVIYGDSIQVSSSHYRVICRRCDTRDVLEIMTAPKLLPVQ